MYLLDTNIISELRRVKPHGAVVAWLGAIDDKDIFIGAPTIGEVQSGVEITRDQDAAKAAEIEAWLDQVAETYNVLPMDARAFRVFARMMHGKSDHLLEDAMIASIAEVHSLTVATRNLKDFKTFGVRTVDPFRSQDSS